jgi:hypothetical protein
LRRVHLLLYKDLFEKNYFFRIITNPNTAATNATSAIIIPVDKNDFLDGFELEDGIFNLWTAFEGLFVGEYFGAYGGVAIGGLVVGYPVVGEYVGAYGGVVIGGLVVGYPVVGLGRGV